MFETGGITDIKSLLPEELAALMKDLGQPAYRGKQIFSWMKTGCGSFDEMTNLPQPCGEPWRSAAIFTRPVC
jgi:23S rRNA (adenine2503-C2)-methyltransferase